MDFYTKLFHRILDSSIWMEDDSTRLVWITMLAMKDENHRVLTTVPNLAYRARVNLEACQRAIEKFTSPDPHSRHTAHEGRRIKKVDGGWELLNGQFYEDLCKAERRKAQNREAQKRLRERQGPSPEETMQVQQFEDGKRTKEQLGDPV